jgi:hypothetical protein
MDNNFTQLALAGKATMFRDLVYDTLNTKLRAALDTKKAEIASSLFTQTEKE